MDARSRFAESESLIAAGVAGLRTSTTEFPSTAVILGSGLGPIRDAVEIGTSWSYDEIPGFRPSTATGHAGRLSVGTLDGSPLVLLEGRTHLYEGGSAELTTRPLRILKQLGVRTLIVTNAAGGLRPDLRVGDIVVLEDCFNAAFANPLIGPHVDSWGVRFPDMSRPFDAELSEWALAAAREAGVRATPGVYAAVSGPNYETRAEQRMFRRIGIDVIGMSTVFETIAANQMGWRVLGLSTVTNCCRPDTPEPTDGASVIQAASCAAEDVLTILRGVTRRLGPE